MLFHNIYEAIRCKIQRRFCRLFPRPDRVLWSKDGGELPDIERMIVEDRELTITTLNKTDNGTYRCEASNPLGTNSAEYTLFVNGR